MPELPLAPQIQILPCLPIIMDSVTALGSCPLRRSEEALAGSTGKEATSGGVSPASASSTNAQSSLHSLTAKSPQFFAT